MFEKSVLLAKANKTTAEQVFAAPINDQIIAYRETLKEMDEFLDTGDLTRVTSDSMGVIKSDLLNIMAGFRRIKEEHPQEAFGFVRSVDEILAKLRPAKIIIFDTEGFFQAGKLKEDGRKFFFDKMEECRIYIEAALAAFHRPGQKLP